MAAAGGAGPSPPSTVYRILGAGSFGTVFEPALPNANGPAGEGRVTKLFPRKKNYDKTLSDAGLLSAAFTGTPAAGSLNSTNVKPYTKQFTVGEVEALTRKSISRKYKNNNAQEITNASPLYAVSLPFLGYDLYTFATNTILRQELEAYVEIETLLLEAIKLLKVVKHIRDQGLIHGDIRETNLLIHPKTGKMTLIDFDLMKPAEEFFNTYSFNNGWFYNHPPESAFMVRKAIDTIKATKGIGERVSDVDVLLDDKGGFWDIYTKKHAGKLTEFVIDSYGWAVEAGNALDFVKTNKVTSRMYGEDINNQQAENYALLRTLCAQTFDQYGLGLCFRYLQQHILDKQKKFFKMANYFMVNLGIPLTNGNAFDRASIDSILQEAVRILQTEFGITPPPVNPSAELQAMEAGAAAIEGGAAAGGAAAGGAAAGGAGPSNKRKARKTRGRNRRSRRRRPS